MKPDEFKSRVKNARTVFEVQRLIHVTLATVAGTYEQVSECLTVAMAKLDCVLEDGNEIGSRREGGICGTEEFNSL